MKKKLPIVLFLTSSLLLFGQNRVTIEITSEPEMKTNASIILVAEKNAFVEQFSKQLVKDLEYSDWFNIRKATFKENIKMDAELDNAFKENISILIVCRIREDFKIEVYDSVEKTMLFTFSVDKGNSPEYLAHVVCDEIVYRITGKPGIAKSKILFVTKKGNLYSIIMTDYDGSNQIEVISTPYIINFPRWFPEKGKIVFLSYRKVFPTLDVLDLKTKQIQTFLGEPGLNACISFFRKQQMAAAVLSRSGNPDIYLVDLKGNILRRLTEKRGINASPSVSPDENNIAFVSDRDGKPRLYIMNQFGLNLRKIDIPSNYITAPAWSPDGKYIAYAVRYGTEMLIEIYDFNTGKRKILTRGKSWSDGPSWAPDSRHLLFTNQEKYINSIWAVDIYTLKTRKIADNAWSGCWDIR